MAQTKTLEQIQLAIKKKFKDRNLVFGSGSDSAKILFVAEIPTLEEVKAGKPLAGASEKYFNQALKKAGIDKKKVYLTNVVKYDSENRNLSPKEIKSNIPFLKEEIKAVNPRVVVTLGNVALNGIGMRQPLSNVRGRIFNLGGYELMPTLHPRESIKTPGATDTIVSDLMKIKDRLK